MKYKLCNKSTSDLEIVSNGQGAEILFGSHCPKFNDQTIWTTQIKIQESSLTHGPLHTNQKF